MPLVWFRLTKLTLIIQRTPEISTVTPRKFVCLLRRKKCMKNEQERFTKRSKAPNRPRKMETVCGSFNLSLEPTNFRCFLFFISACIFCYLFNNKKERYVIHDSNIFSIHYFIFSQNYNVTADKRKRTYKPRKLLKSVKANVYIRARTRESCELALSDFFKTYFLCSTIQWERPITEQ